jgi:hypothetical protein
MFIPEVINENGIPADILQISKSVGSSRTQKTLPVYPLCMQLNPVLLFAPQEIHPLTN